MNFSEEYKSKLRTADQAVSVIKSGDWIDYTVALGFPVLCDAALAKRKSELHDVKIRGNLLFGPIKVVECDPEREHFTYNSWHCSAYERKLCDRGLCNYIPIVFRYLEPYYRTFLNVNVAMVSVTPMDKHGYFNLSTAVGFAKGILNKADVVIVEVNEHLPKVYGGWHECIHISEIDYIVEGTHPPLPEAFVPEATAEEKKIAEYITPLIKDGSTLQLGIGGLPGALGKVLSDSDVKDLGMHTELCTDAYVDLHNSGKLTNRKKKLHPGKGVTGFVIGSNKIYEWVDENPEIMIVPIEYVNSPTVISKIDNMISINSAVSMDLFGQVCAESAGLRHISGTGGQLDFLTGASESVGGKAFICMTSSFTDKQGVRHSRIKPYFTGDIVTDPRTQAYYIVTEYGLINLAGKTTWERAESIVSIAHPDFRDELIAEAEKLHIWRNSNKR